VSEATFRAFVGLPIPPPIRHALGEMQAAFRHAGVRAAWVAPENFHITLRFLGNITYAQLESLDSALGGALANCRAMQFSLDGADVFPDMGHPAVVWAGLRALHGDADGLYAAVCEAAAAIGVAPGRRHVQAHVTLCRLRRGHAPSARLQEALAAARARVSDEFWVDSVALWRSELRRGGAVYHQIKEYPLQCLPSIY